MPLFVAPFSITIWGKSTLLSTAVDVEKEIQDEAAVQHHLLDRLDLRIVTAPVQERAIVLVIDGIASNVENLLLELDEFIFELDLVHRTIVGLFCVLFHAAKLRHEDAKEWQEQKTTPRFYKALNY